MQRRDDFEDDGYSFRVRRVMQLGRMAEAAAIGNSRSMRFARIVLIPVWIAAANFIGTVIFVAGYAVWLAL